MILDTLQNAQLYKNLDENLSLGLEYLQNTDFSSLEMGKYEIKGDEVFAILQSYDTKEVSDCRLEAHQKYVDIQYMVSGNEIMGVVPFANQEISEDLPENDVTFYKGAGLPILVEEGSFTIFFQTDVHAPGIKIETSTKIIKVVVKVKLKTKKR